MNIAIGFVALSLESQLRMSVANPKMHSHRSSYLVKRISKNEYI